MRSWSVSNTEGPSSSAAAACEEEKPRKRRRGFCLVRMKSRSGSGKQPQPQQQQHLPAADNNNTPFMIHCQIGKEIKHICSNCRGAEQLDGERSSGGIGLTAPCLPGIS